jgi:tetratricopeptide (TPR) repeat protein
MAAALCAVPLAALAQDVRPDAEAARARLVAARSELSSGNFERSRELFESSLLLALTARDSATAFFGQSFAAQQATDSSSLVRGAVGRLVQGYKAAQRLDSARYYVAAQQNIGLVYGAAGYHRQAADEYLNGARVSDTLRPELLLSAGRELMLARLPSDAVKPLRAAASDSAVAPDAQKLLLRVYAESNDTASLLTLADSLTGSTAPLAAVNEALLASLEKADQPARHGRTLVLIARNAALLEVPPADTTSPDWAWRGRLTAVTRGTTVAAAVDALTDAHRKRRDDGPYRPRPGASWWMYPANGGRAAWSSAMRSIGDWYFQTGARTTARGFYEAAIGLPDHPMQFGERWVDLEALPPLAEIYGSQVTPAGAPTELRLIDDFVRALFSGKGEALAASDLRRIRLFRLTLGTLFARQARWDGGWNGAISQLEDTRRLTAQIAREDPEHAPHNPPEPFELLATEYKRRGCVAQARAAAREALTEFRRRGLTEDADRVDAFVSSLGAAPAGAPIPERCTGRSY